MKNIKAFGIPEMRVQTDGGNVAITVKNSVPMLREREKMFFKKKTSRKNTYYFLKIKRIIAHYGTFSVITDFTFCVES